LNTEQTKTKSAFTISTVWFVVCQTINSWHVFSSVSFFQEVGCFDERMSRRLEQR
jgi:hypothetical protein